MSADFKRSDRVAGMIQRKLAQIIQKEVKDPRLPKLTTVSAVKVSSDLTQAKVYITVLGDESQVEQALSILNAASSYLRSALARTLTMRSVPQLQFIFDSSLEYGNRIQQLLSDVIVDDEEGDNEAS